LEPSHCIYPHSVISARMRDVCFTVLTVWGGYIAWLGRLFSVRDWAALGHARPRFALEYEKEWKKGKVQERYLNK
jgi:hypothetical protein